MQYFASEVLQYHMQYKSCCKCWNIHSIIQSTAMFNGLCAGVETDGFWHSGFSLSTLYDRLVETYHDLQFANQIIHLTQHTSHLITSHSCWLSTQRLTCCLTYYHTSRWLRGVAIERWTCVVRSWVPFSPGQSCVATLGELFTSMCLCHQAV